MFIRKLLLCSLVLPCIAMADNVPLPPTANDLENSQTCTSYAQGVADYFNSHSADNFNNLMSAIWFYDFASTQNDSRYSEQCNNGKCTVQYDGGDHGCYVAGVAKATPAQELLEQLTRAYTLAMQMNDIGKSGRYGFYGAKNTCTSSNSYQNCELLVSK